MSATKTPTARKTLASQLDRLDAVLDGLSDAIPQAVADAVRIALATAVRDAVQAAVAEVMSNPVVLARVREVVVPAQAEPALVPEPVPTPAMAPTPRRVCLVTARVRSAFDIVGRLASAARDQARIAHDRVRESVVQAGAYAGQQAERLKNWRKPAAASLGVAAGVCLTGYFAGPACALALCGIASFGLCLAGTALAAGVR